MKMTTLELAQTVGQRYPIFPCKADKSPGTARGFLDATQDAETIRDWFADGKFPLIGVPTGRASGLFVIDCDGDDGAAWLDAHRLVLPTTREHSTRRGTHLIFKMPAESYPCSVSKLGLGVDTRGESGYVIWWAAAGLPFKAEALAEVPPSILKQLTRSAPVGDTTDVMSLSHKERVGTPIVGARQLLAMVDPDTDYDTWYKVGAALEHEYGDAGLALWQGWSRQGRKYPGDSEIEAKWSSFGSYDGVPITLRYLLKLTKEQRAEAKPSSVAATAPGPWRIVDVAELMEQPPQDWIVRGLIPQADLGMLFAPGGAGKTFFTIDLGLHIAAGLPWRDRPTKRRKLLYVCAEGAGGFGTRVKAALQANPNLAVAMAEPDTVFKVLQGAPNFLDDDQVDGLVGQAKELGGFDFIVFDTVSRITPGGNENSAETMGKMIGNCQKFSAAFGAFVLLLHHPGKDAAKGARGWSGVFGALDVEIEISRNGDTRVARVTKKKDGGDGEQFGFRLETVTVDGAVDSDGFPVTSCRVEPTADLSKNDKVRKKDGPIEALIMSAAADLAGVMGGPFDKEVLFKAVREEMDHDPEKRDRRRDVFGAALTRLKGDFRLTFKGDIVELLP